MRTAFDFPLTAGDDGAAVSGGAEEIAVAADDDEGSCGATPAEDEVDGMKNDEDENGNGTDDTDVASAADVIEVEDTLDATTEARALDG